MVVFEKIAPISSYYFSEIEMNFKRNTSKTVQNAEVENMFPKLEGVVQ